jgi:hypothetical protein
MARLRRNVAGIYGSQQQGPSAGESRHELDVGGADLVGQAVVGAFRRSILAASRIAVSGRIIRPERVVLSARRSTNSASWAR